MTNLGIWSARPSDEAALFNPAFLALALHRAAKAHYLEIGAHLPFALAFLITPLVLVRPIRQALPRSVRTSLGAWLHANSHHRLVFPEHARRLREHTREGILFGISHQGLRLTEDTKIEAMKLTSNSAKKIKSGTKEYQDTLAKSEFAGRWLARAGTPSTVMAFWGVKP